MLSLFLSHNKYLQNRLYIHSLFPFLSLGKLVLGSKYLHKRKQTYCLESKDKSPSHNGKVNTNNKHPHTQRVSLAVLHRAWLDGMMSSEVPKPQTIAEY